MNRIRMTDRRAILRGALATGILALGSAPVLAQGPAIELTQETVFRDPQAPVLGNPDGDVTIVEFFDYQCPYCKKVHPVLTKVVAADGNVRLVMKDWAIFGDVSVYASRLALAAQFQAKYPQAVAALMEVEGRLSEDLVKSTLAKAGVDVAKAESDLRARSGEIDALMARNSGQAEAFGFNGTPGFVIGRFTFPGVMDEAGLKQAISDVRAAN